MSRWARAHRRPARIPPETGIRRAQPRALTWLWCCSVI
ncbi:hypothetical protein KCH_10340 [Kitasatospora cheerisanensis KCTC 2395]|uniref:Uncharacterized protein n=1 Tax=Kitasatospora cheerisanensis KCTC 2395 TaxID=1348663 RepID=A0A066Z0C1_9ACTN|nr:hypothetical protein KCH_10340 [Kitasatospora cheerisanensis KCTC 2395]